MLGFYIYGVRGGVRRQRGRTRRRRYDRHVPISDLASISELASFQTVKVDLFKDGVDVTKLNAPRSTLLRAYLSLGKRWKKALVNARLDVTADGRDYSFTDSKNVYQSSTASRRSR